MTRSGLSASRSTSCKHGRPLSLGHRARLEHRLGGALHDHPRAVGHRATPRSRADARDRTGTGRCARSASRSPAASTSARSTGSCAAAAPCAAAAVPSTRSRSPATSLDHQPVLGQRPGLVGQQHGHGADGLGGAQTPQQDAVLRQAQAAKRDECGHEDRQLLGDRGERERQPARAASRAAGWPRSTPSSGTSTHAVTATISAYARQLGHRALQRGGRLLGLRDQPAEPPDLGVVAERDDDALAGAGHHGACPRAAPRSARRAARRRGPARAPSRPTTWLAGEPGLVRPRGRRPPRRGRRRRRCCRPRRAGRRRSTRSPTGTACATPARRTSALGALRSRSARSARFARTSAIASTAPMTTMTEEDRDRVAQLAEDRREHRRPRSAEACSGSASDSTTSSRIAAAWLPSVRTAAVPRRCSTSSAVSPSGPAARCAPTPPPAGSCVDRDRPARARAVTRGRCARHETHDMSAGRVTEPRNARGISVLQDNDWLLITVSTPGGGGAAPRPARCLWRQHRPTNDRPEESACTTAGRAGFTIEWARQDSNLDLTDYESAKSRQVWLTRAKSRPSCSDSKGFGSTVREHVWNTDDLTCGGCGSWAVTVAEHHVSSSRQTASQASRASLPPCVDGKQSVRRVCLCTAAVGAGRRSLVTRRRCAVRAWDRCGVVGSVRAFTRV